MNFLNGIFNTSKILSVSDDQGSDLDVKKNKNKKEFNDLKNGIDSLKNNIDNQKNKKLGEMKAKTSKPMTQEEKQEYQDKIRYNVNTNKDKLKSILGFKYKEDDKETKKFNYGVPSSSSSRDCTFNLPVYFDDLIRFADKVNFKKYGDKNSKYREKMDGYREDLKELDKKLIKNPSYQSDIDAYVPYKEKTTKLLEKLEAKQNKVLDLFEKRCQKDTNECFKKVKDMGLLELKKDDVSFLKNKEVFLDSLYKIKEHFEDSNKLNSLEKADRIQSKRNLNVLLNGIKKTLSCNIKDRLENVSNATDEIIKYINGNELKVKNKTKKILSKSLESIKTNINSLEKENKFGQAIKEANKLDKITDVLQNLINDDLNKDIDNIAKNIKTTKDVAKLTDNMLEVSQKRENLILKKLKTEFLTIFNLLHSNLKKPLDINRVDDIQRETMKYIEEKNISKVKENIDILNLKKYK